MSLPLRMLCVGVMILAVQNSQALTCVNQSHELTIDLELNGTDLVGFRVHDEAKRHRAIGADKLFLQSPGNYKIGGQGRGAPGIELKLPSSVILTAGNGSMERLLGEMGKNISLRRLDFNNCK